MNDATLRTLIDETVQRAADLTPAVRVMPGTVVDATDLAEVQVLVDGDTDPIVGQSIIGALATADRVMVMFNPPSGLLIFGICP